MERLQKIIAQSGICSRRKAEELIVAGKVYVDGVQITTLGYKASLSSEIVVDGKKLEKEDLEYYVLYKPQGYISSTSDEVNRKVVTDLIETNKRIYPIGRLDYDTTGVLLLTNDGDFHLALSHPKFHVEKEYFVKCKGLIRKEESKLLESGVNIGDGVTAPAKVLSVEYTKERKNSFVSIVINEGKYHQVKRMFEAIGHEVVKLKRVRFGNITLEGLNIGDSRRLKPHEIKTLWNLANNGQNKK